MGGWENSVGKKIKTSEMQKFTKQIVIKERTVKWENSDGISFWMLLVQNY